MALLRSLLWIRVQSFLKKLKLEEKKKWSNYKIQPIPGHVCGENHNLDKYMYVNVHCSTIYNSQDMEATSMPINR